MMMNLPCLMASCANFLRPICSYTECQLSFQTGSCPTERTTASYSSCLSFDCYWPSFAAGTVFSGRLPYYISWSWCWCSALHTPSGLRVSFPEPCPIPDNLWTPARVWNCNAILSITLCCLLYCLIRPYNVSQQFFRIIGCPFCQDCKNHPQYLAGNHYERLHLF